MQLFSDAVNVWELEGRSSVLAHDQMESGMKTLKLHGMTTRIYLVGFLEN